METPLLIKNTIIILKLESIKQPPSKKPLISIHSHLTN